MKDIAKIQKILDLKTTGLLNKTDDTFINVVHNEFIIINGEIIVPKISVKELDYKTSIGIVEEITDFIPQFLSNHQILKERKPASDQHMLQFVQKRKGKLLHFIHIFKIDLKFGGDSSNIIKKGNSDFHPSYKTNRIYFKSRVFPVWNDSSDNALENFKSINILDSQYVESDQYFHTYAIFEDANTREITEKILSFIDSDIFSISTKIYPFLVFDYLTCALNILNPTNEEIEKGIKILEPLFLYVYSKFKDISIIVDLNDVDSEFEELIIENESIELHNEYKKSLAEYFKQYSIVRDDDLSLKGWWKIENQ